MFVMMTGMKLFYMKIEDIAMKKVLFLEQTAYGMMNGFEQKDCSNKRGQIKLYSIYVSMEQ